MRPLWRSGPSVRRWRRMTATGKLPDAPASFEIRLAPAREVVRIKPVGELDLAAVPVLSEQVRELLVVGFEQLVIDLRGVSFIDVAGVEQLVCLADDAQRDGWRLWLIQGDEVVRRVFELTETLVRLPFSAPAAGDRSATERRGGQRDGRELPLRYRLPKTGEVEDLQVILERAQRAWVNPDTC